MKFFPKKHNAGIGLIEVLVTTVVVAVGLLAVASLQGNLMGGSRDNKTRAECQTLANTKIEQLRDTVVTTGISGYDALTSSAANENIVGVTEIFSRGWVVTNQTDPTRKQVGVTVTWGDGSAQNQCAVQSVIAFDGLGSSTLAAKGSGEGTGSTIGGPSTKAGSSDEITETIKLTTAGTPGSVITVDNKTYIVDDNPLKASRAYLCGDSSLALTEFENDLYTRRLDYDQVGNAEAIELYEKVVVSGVEYCMPRIRFNGSVIIPIRGVVHSAVVVGNNTNQTWLDVKMFTFNASESGTYCVFKPATGTRSAPYVCYVGGNCTSFAGVTSTDVTECPGAIAAAKVGPGGWRGKVGLLGVAGSSSEFKNVCFAEELAGAPTELDTARNYFTRNAVNGNNEGINKPYECHNFLIIKGQPTKAKVHKECAKQARDVAGLILASKEIRRDISGTNVFNPVIDVTYCGGTAGTQYIITGPITGATTSPNWITVTDGINTAECTPITSSSYTCTITTITNSVTIRGLYNSEPASCNLPLSKSALSPTGCELKFLGNLPEYTIKGRIRISTEHTIQPSAADAKIAADAIVLDVMDEANKINCTNNKDYDNSLGYGTYTCTIKTATTTDGIEIDATGSDRYSVTPASYEIKPLSGQGTTVEAPIVVPSPEHDFVVKINPIYTISGTITRTNVDATATLSVAVDSGTGSCNFTSTGYTCTVKGGVVNHLSITHPICALGNPKKKYTLSADGTTSETGQLVINLGTVTGNITKNISVTRSTNNC